MNISNAIHLVREARALRHFSLKTEKTYVYWIGRYGTFLRDFPFPSANLVQKMEAFLGRLAKEGISASTQNQALNAVLSSTGKCSSVYQAKGGKVPKDEGQDALVFVCGDVLEIWRPDAWLAFTSETRSKLDHLVEDLPDI